MTVRILEQVRFKLLLSGRTQRDVEERIGFSRGYLSQILTGHIDIKYWQLIAVLHAMDVEPADLFADIFPRHPALTSLEALGTQAPNRPLSGELARLYAFGIESIFDLYERLGRCEKALDELADLGVLKHRDP